MILATHDVMDAHAGRAMESADRTDVHGPGSLNARGGDASVGVIASDAIATEQEAPRRGYGVVEPGARSARNIAHNQTGVFDAARAGVSISVNVMLRASCALCKAFRRGRRLEPSAQALCENAARAEMQPVSVACAGAGTALFATEGALPADATHHNALVAVFAHRVGHGGGVAVRRAFGSSSARAARGGQRAGTGYEMAHADIGFGGDRNADETDYVPLALPHGDDDEEAEVSAKSFSFAHASNSLRGRTRISARAFCRVRCLVRAYPRCLRTWLLRTLLIARAHAHRVSSSSKRVHAHRLL